MGEEQETLSAEDEQAASEQGEEDAGQNGTQMEERRDVKTWATRGAVIGAATGGAAGAGIGAVLVSRPELLRSAKEAFEGSGKHVVRAVTAAVSEVLTSRSVRQLVSGSGNGDRTEAMKDTAKEAGAAAATAARDALLALRSEGS